MSKRADRLDLVISRQKAENILLECGVDPSKIKTAQIAAVLEDDGKMRVVMLVTEKEP